MPKLGFPKLYDVTSTVAKRKFQNQKFLLDKYSFKLDTGSPMYRFVNYRNLKPQFENGGRTIWTKLDDDIWNRWTGRGTDVNGQSTGTQGLYLSLDADGPVDTKFPEVSQYQDASVPPNQTVHYFEYRSGQKPEWKSTKASELRSMFLFTLNKPLLGVDFSFDDRQDSILMQIFNEAKQEVPDAFDKGVTLKDLYFASEDASFNRAIGNALFETTIYGAFKATSVRDYKSINLVVTGKSGIALDFLQPQGRATFLIDGVTKKSIGVVTVDDMIYNNTFEPTDPKLPPNNVIQDDLRTYTDFAENINNELDWEYVGKGLDSRINQEVINALQSIDHPFKNETDSLVKQIETYEFLEEMKKSLENDVALSASTDVRYTAAVKEIGAEGMSSLLSSLVADPKYKKLTEVSSTGETYFTAAIRSTILEKKRHWLAEESSNIQSRLSAADTRVTETSTEISKKQQDLQQIEQALKEKPQDQDLLNQQTKLNGDIAELVRDQQEAEQDRASAEKDRKDNEQERGDNSTEKTEAEKRLHERQKHDWARGERV
ncbi:hypothetical protein H8B09_11745 [Paenibacillus sp. PR3]|uniref:Uncharacterized protein n=1 Tax=Paenibacillus terricola TaxID=2763503 RepID=A0ABR8MU04_9BACL|nr:hypothetical protein [Paenibacillus terricola]MBD3919427.1 hypothetical protein [Paenibacillus terricola]